MGITTGRGGASSRISVARNASRDLDDGWWAQGRPGKRCPDFSPIFFKPLDCNVSFCFFLCFFFFFLRNRQNFFYSACRTPWQPHWPEATVCKYEYAAVLPLLQQDKVRLNDNCSREKKRIRWMVCIFAACPPPHA